MLTVEATRAGINRHVRAVAAVTALGGLLFGYDTGVVSGALLFLKTQFGGLSSFQEELVTSFLLVGAMMGVLAAGRGAARIARRPLLLLTGTAGMALGMVITGLAFLGGNQLHGRTAYLGIA